MAYRSNSDTFKLRRLISSLKDSGSELGEHLESQAGQFFGGVYIVRSKNPLTQEVKFDSDDEGDTNEFVNHTNYIRKQKSDHENTRIDEINQRKSKELCQKPCEDRVNINGEINGVASSETSHQKKKESNEERLHKMKQTKEYIDNILSNDRLVIEAENIRKRKKRADDIKKLDEKLKKEEEEQHKRLFENKNEGKTSNLQQTESRDLNNGKPFSETIPKETNDSADKSKLFETNCRNKSRVPNEINIEDEKDCQSETEKKILEEEIARKKVEEEYEKLKKEREQEKITRAKREEERMNLLKRINEERERRLKESEEEARLRQLEDQIVQKQRTKQMEEEIEDNIDPNTYEISVDISAEEERLRIAQEKIRELEYSIHSLDFELERFEIEKMNEKTNNVKKRMSIVMGEEAVYEYFHGK